MAGLDDLGQCPRLRLAEALIQGDEQGYFADKAYSDQVSARRSNGVGWSTAWRGAVGRITRSKPGRGS